MALKVAAGDNDNFGQPDMKEVNEMREIRNPENRLVYCIDEKTKVVERLEKGWITKIEFKADGTVEITHHKKLVA